MGQAAGIGVRQVSEGDWELWRALRLNALEEAPYAFGSSHAEALARDEAWWRSWWTADEPGTRFIVEVDGEPAGMCAIGYFPGAGGRASLISMWVAPQARGTGAGAALVEAAEQWTRAAGHGELLLGVVEDNLPAKRLYESLGYAPTGETEPLRSNPAKLIVTMSRSLA
jgi:GNAT superfamily N-acetyltransferase